MTPEQKAWYNKTHSERMEEIQRVAKQVSDSLESLTGVKWRGHLLDETLCLGATLLEEPKVSADMITNGPEFVWRVRVWCRSSVVVDDSGEKGVKVMIAALEKARKIHAAAAAACTYQWRGQVPVVWPSIDPEDDKIVEDLFARREKKGTRQKLTILPVGECT